MTDLTITSGNEWSAWLWFLLIPLVAVALLLFFRVSAKQRRTRYRIASLVLHVLVAVFSVAILTGLTFEYHIPYHENELIIVVDVSASLNFDIDREGMSDQAFLNSPQFRESAQGRINSFVRSVINANENDVFQVGIVLFARNYSLAAPLSRDMNAVFNQFEQAVLSLPEYLDTSATNIAAALNFASTQFTSPLAGRKIILISDGVETDGSAMVAITRLVSENILVDTVHIERDDVGNEVQINAILLPDENFEVGDTITLRVVLQSSFQGRVDLILYNNNVASAPVSYVLPVGVHQVRLTHTFESPGAQQLFVRIEAGDDRFVQNNQYYVYLFLDVFDSVLILDRNSEGRQLEYLLNSEGGQFSSPVVHMDINDAPTTLRELSRFDQIVLVNIANRDMPSGFDILLHQYVYDLGGGLLVVGGTQSDGLTANAFCREDLNPNGVPSLFQEMLPVQAVEYYPPLALMIVLDVSGSMNFVDNPAQNPLSRIALARLAAIEAIRALSYRDYVGIITFSNFANIVAPLTPVPQTAGLENIIRNITAGGGTNYAPALTLANQHIMAERRNVHNRHIMFITDGEPTDDGGLSASHGILETINRNGISLSVIAIMSEDLVAVDTVNEMVRRAGGRGQAHINRNVAMLRHYVRADLMIPAIRDITHERFTPAIHSATRETLVTHPESGELERIDADLIPPLDGFFGTRLKIANDNNALVMPLTGPYGIPIYARWVYGRGRVGAFTSDLSGQQGSFSYDFLNMGRNEGMGLTLVANMIRGLLPSHDIEVPDMQARFTKDNYTVNVAVDTITPMSELDNVAITITDVTITDGTTIDGIPSLGRERIGEFIVFADLAGGIPRASFEFPATGIFRIRTVQTGLNGTIIDHTAYLTFSYSREFNMFPNQYAARSFLYDLAQRGGGQLISTAQPAAALRDIQWTAQDYYNPRTVLLILILALFLIDIAVRKFKFRWPWEIIRDRKLKKELQTQ